MSTSLGEPLEAQIAQWRTYVSRRRVLQGPDVEELEEHLREELAALGRAGLTGDEAFLVAVGRLGSLDALSREFGRAHSERLWKQLVIGGAEGPLDQQAQRERWVVLGLAVAAGVAVKIPALFGLRFNDGLDPFYIRNASLLVLPLLTAYFVWKRGASAVMRAALAVAFTVAAVAANAVALPTGSDIELLRGLHLPIALWLVVGMAYVRGQWRVGGGPMNFVRFSGELAIYYVLIALGGLVLNAFTFMMFRAIGREPVVFATEWLLPCGAAGAVLVAAWLVEAKQSVIENMAPVLTRLFTPLFAALLLVFLVTMAWTRSPILLRRELLIGFDLLLALIVGLVLYALSARDPDAPPDVFDALQLVLVVTALVVDGVALAAIAGRISEFGFTPNRVAALGENILLLVNLAGSAWFYAAFLRRRGSFGSLERWQTAYLPIYSVWAAVVVLLFPLIFGTS